MTTPGAMEATAFVGRSGEIGAVDRALSANGAPRVAITGPAGIGKSALARAFVAANRGRHKRVRWLTADSASCLALGLRTIGTVSADDLHVLDDAAAPEAIAALVDAIRGPVLLTTRAPRWESSATIVALEAPSQDEATEMLLAMAPDAGRAAAASLARCLGALPAALRVAAAHARAAPVGLDEVERRLVAAAATYRYMPSDGARMVGLLDIALEHAGAAHADADKLMACLAVMAPRPVPWPMRFPGIDVAGAAATLAAAGLVDVAAGEAPSATVRAGFMAAARVRMKWRELEIETITRVAEALDAATLSADPAAMSVLAPHLLRAFDRTDPRPPDVEALAAAAVRAATTLRDAGFAGDGFPLLAAAWTAATAWPQLQALTLDMQDRVGAFPDDPPARAARAATKEAAPPARSDPEVDAAMARAAELSAAGERGRACAAYERALLLAERRLGPEHPRTADILCEMSLALLDRGDVDAALTAAGRSLTLRESARPPVPLDVAQSSNNLGLALARGADPSAARPHYEGALATFRRVHGADHATTATTTANLAVLLERIGERDGARSRYEEAIRAYAAAGGEDDPNLNRVRASYAALLMAAGETARAVALARDAHAHHLRRLGADHLWTSDSAARLADCEAAHRDATDTSRITRPHRGDGKHGR